ncbi:zinc ribbon domain-containing protein [Methanobrevibacter sp.]|uniref:zinc ribbon domain-containing protein n=1 Tax=Methanobrevibacter sp. TaxID=66852 RepID=UPI003890E1A5
MICPECKSENSDSAKFCKKCGKPLKKTINHESMINEMSKESSTDTTKIIIVALIIVAVVLAGAFIYLFGFSNDETAQDSQAQSASNSNPVSTVNQPTQSSSESASPTPTTTAMRILGGSFSTGSGLSDKTYASIYVGKEHSGEKVKIQIYYSRDGSSLNNGNMVPKTVDSSGYIEVASADSYKYFPDFATINLYDNSGNLLDTKSVSLSPSSGTQSF